jgi:hypothetical protein
MNTNGRAPGHYVEVDGLLAEHHVTKDFQLVGRYRRDTLAASLPTLRNLTPELDRLLNALFFVALLLYLAPAAFGLGRSPAHRRWLQLAAIITLTIAMAIAVITSAIWFTR